MDTRNKRSDADVDDILEQLRGTKPAEKSSDSALDDILSEMGFGNDAGRLPQIPKTKPKPTAKTPYRSKAEPNKATEATPLARKVEPAAAPPASKGKPQQEVKVVEDGAPVVIKKKVAQEPETDTRVPEKAALGDTNLSIWDVGDIRETNHEAGKARMGKAAAFDKVDRQKFTGDTELLSWFSGEDPDQGLSKKELRQAEKERKRQLAAERKEEKARKNRGESLEDEGEFLAFKREEAPEETEAPLWGQTPEPESVIGSAFDEPEETWEEDKSLFDSAVSKSRRRNTPAATVTEKQATSRPPQREAAPANIPTPPKPVAVPIPPVVPQSAVKPIVDAAQQETMEILSATVSFEAISVEEVNPKPKNQRQDTRAFDVGEGEEAKRVPTAAYTQEFESASVMQQTAAAPEEGNKNLFVDEMVDDRFREFFSETVIVERAEIERGTNFLDKIKRKNKKSKTSLLTGEFSQIAELAEQAEEQEEEGDYSHPQDAQAIEDDIKALRASLTRRSIITGVLTVLLLWLGAGFVNIVPVPAFMHPATSPILFAVVYLALVAAAIGVNFTTIAPGLIGLAGEPTSDSPPALAAIGALLQGVVLLVQISAVGRPQVTLFGGLAALLLTFNAIGKRLRTRSILFNFQLASAGFDHSAGYVLDGGQEVARHITKGLEENDPAILVSRPTALVKGFLQQSFSERWSDVVGRILGWVLSGVSLVIAIIVFVQTKNLLLAVSSFAATLCVAAPLSSSLLSAIPSTLLQQSTSKVGAVVPGWSAIEELGRVNVVMAGARDIFPPSSVRLRGIKTFQKERIDLAILYAASVLIQGCDTMRDIFLEVIQGKSDMLYKVENLNVEPGRGFTAWVENSRIVIGNREMLQKHDITPPPLEVEMKHVPEGCMPVYLAVSGKLFAMFVVAYEADPEVQDTLESLVQSGVSLLITSEDMNVSNELIERVYQLPQGVVKVMGRRELDLLEPLTEYLPESEGVMAHIGTFTSFIGGMRAAAGCAAAERMSGIIQIASVGLACLLCLLLGFSGSLANLSATIAIFYQFGWSVLISALPFAKRY